MAHPAVDWTQHGAPIYVQLSTLFRRFIVTGQWPVDHQVPTHENLAGQFRVDPATVRHAIGFLHREGLLTSRRGRGTEVTGVPKTNLWQQLPDSWEELLRSADNIDGDMLELARPMRLPESPQTDKGMLAPGYHVVRRLLKRDGIPYLVGTSYIDRRIIVEVGENFLQRGSVYRAMEASQKFRPVRGDQQLTLGMADAELAFLLETPLSAAVVNVLRWVFDAQGTLIYQSEGQFRSDFVQATRRLI